MLLKDCPVGSVVRLVSFEGRPANHPWWQGNFTVEKGLSGNFVTYNDGTRRLGIYNDPDYQFEIVNPAPEPRVKFTVGGQEFYVGQRVWNLEDGGILKSGEEIEILGVMPHSDEYVTVRKIGTHQVCQAEVGLLSTTPPAPHEWKCGDWARHEDGRTAFICGAAKLHGEYGPISLMVSFENEAITNISASEFTFISHSEPPK